AGWREGAGVVELERALALLERVYRVLVRDALVVRGEPAVARPLLQLLRRVQQAGVAGRDRRVAVDEAGDVLLGAVHRLQVPEQRGGGSGFQRLEVDRNLPGRFDLRAGRLELGERGRHLDAESTEDGLVVVDTNDRRRGDRCRVERAGAHL